MSVFVNDGYLLSGHSIGAEGVALPVAIVLRQGERSPERLYPYGWFAPISAHSAPVLGKRHIGIFTSATGGEENFFAFGERPSIQGRNGHGQERRGCNDGMGVVHHVMYPVCMTYDGPSIAAGRKVQSLFVFDVPMQCSGWNVQVLLLCLGIEGGKKTVC